MNLQLSQLLLVDQQVQMILFLPVVLEVLLLLFLLVVQHYPFHLSDLFDLVLQLDQGDPNRKQTERMFTTEYV